jgi:hypothetical protein
MVKPTAKRKKTLAVTCSGKLAPGIARLALQCLAVSSEEVVLFVSILSASCFCHSPATSPTPPALRL